MAKQNEVTAASMVRRARAHMELAKTHRATAKDKSLPVHTRRHHASIGLTHSEDAKILRDEAAEIRSHR